MAVLRGLVLAVGVSSVATAAGVAQEQNPAAPAPRVAAEPDDLELDEVQPDFTVVNLPTTLRLPRHKLAFRVTHRFARPLGQGDLGDLAADFFGFDSGAQIGLELRFGLLAGTQLGIYRTSDRTIQLFAAHDLLQQGRHPLGLAAFATFEGFDNLQEQLSPGVALVLSRNLGTRAAVYAVPAWVDNTNPDDGPGADEGTFFVGLGGRLRLGESFALVGEAAPRLAGHEHAGTLLTFGIERRVGGHGFQFNFSNSLGSTLAQVARGGGELRHSDGTRGSNGGGQWYIGFNISRKFY